MQLNVRHPGEKFVIRHENEWPLARTEWTKFYPDPDGMGFAAKEPEKAATKAFEALGEGLTFRTQPLDQETEITGPLAAKLWVSSSTTDADLFLVFRVFDRTGKEVLFQGALDPAAPVGQGWLRMSQRKLDPKLSRPYRPFHSHDEKLPVKPGEVYELDIEIWPTCIVIPKGYTFGFTVLGRDYENGLPAGTLSNMKNPMKGCGPFVHDDPDDRPASVFGGTTTLHFAPGKMPYVLVPVVPKK